MPRSHFVWTGFACLCSGACVSVLWRRWQGSLLAAPPKPAAIQGQPQKTRRDSQTPQNSEVVATQPSNRRAIQSGSDKSSSVGANTASGRSACVSINKTSGSSSSGSSSNISSSGGGINKPKVNVSASRDAVRSAGKICSASSRSLRIRSLSNPECGGGGRVLLPTTTTTTTTTEHLSRGGRKSHPSLPASLSTSPATDALPQQDSISLGSRRDVESGYSSLEKPGRLDSSAPLQQYFSLSDGCDSSQELSNHNSCEPSGGLRGGASVHWADYGGTPAAKAATSRQLPHSSMHMPTHISPPHTHGHTNQTQSLSPGGADSSRTRSPGREEVNRLFGRERRRSQVIGQFERENAPSTSSPSPSSSSSVTWSEDIERHHVGRKQEPDHLYAGSSRFSGTRSRRSKSLDRNHAGHHGTSTPDLINLKKGWMTRLGEDGQWKKHWFVLTDQSLRFYRDSVAEAAADLDGEINLSTCYDVTDFPVQKNFGFQIHTKEGVFTLCAMTSGIRQNWIQAMKKGIRPPANPDVTSCAMPRFVGTRGSTPVTSTPLETEKRSRVRERRREGRYKTYDWAEFCKIRPTKEESTSSTTAQQQQPPQDSSASPPASSSSLHTTSSIPSSTSLCSTSGQPIRDGPQEGEGSEHAGDKTPINSSGGSSISAAQALLPPVLCLTLPGESDSSFHGDGSVRRRTDEGRGERRGGLTFDLREERRDSKDNDKGDIKPLKISQPCLSPIHSSSSSSSSSSLSSTTTVRTDLLQRKDEIKALHNKLDATYGSGLPPQREDSTKTEERLRVELADRTQQHQEAESKRKEAESRLQDLQSCLERAESALQQREEAVRQLKSRLEAAVGRLKSIEQAEEQKEQRLKKHLLLLQESQERERRSLGASLELAEQRGEELEERLKQREANWAAEAQRRGGEVEAKRAELETRCAALAAQLEESDGEVARLRERLRGEETLYYDLEHNYERVCEELECAKGREQSCTDRCNHLLERKERELQEMLVKMAALGTSLEETEQRLREAREERNKPCPSCLRRAAQEQQQKPQASNPSTPTSSHIEPTTSFFITEDVGLTSERGEEPDKVISVIQALESKLSDTEERLREITLHLQQQQQQHSSTQEQQQQHVSDDRSAPGPRTRTPVSCTEPLCSSLTKEQEKVHCTNDIILIQTECCADGKISSVELTVGQGNLDPETVHAETALALALVLGKMGSALQNPDVELQARITELHREAHKQKSAHGNKTAAYLLSHRHDLGRSTTSSGGAVETPGGQDSKAIINACVNAELTYIIHSLLTDTFHGGSTSRFPLDDDDGDDDDADEDGNWGTTGGGELHSRTKEQPKPDDLSHPELTPYEGLEDELHEEDNEPQGRGEEGPGLLAELHTQAQLLHRLSLQLQTGGSRLTADSTSTHTQTPPAVLREVLVRAQLIYVAWRVWAGVQREVSSLRSQYERVVSECQAVCSSMETLFQEQAERYEARLREESHALDRALDRLEKEEEGRATAENSAQQRAEEVQRLEAEFREKLQELQEIHEEEMARLHGYYAKTSAAAAAAAASTSSRSAAESPGDRAGLVSVANLKERIRELEEEVCGLKEEMKSQEETRGGEDGMTTQETKHQKDMESLKVTFERGVSSMEESHRKVLEDVKRQHQREVERLKEERDQLLQEETNATISAIEAMRKAHVAELEKTQRSQHSKASTDTRSLHSHYHEELRSLHRELEVLSEQYSHKCLENRQLSRAIEAERHALISSQRETQDLHSENQGLKKRLAAEISRQRSYKNGESKETTEGQIMDLYQLEVTVRVRESEIQCMRQEISSLKDELQVSSRHCEDLYFELRELKSHRDSSHMRGDYILEGFDLKRSRSSPAFWKESFGLNRQIQSKVHPQDALSPEEKMKLFETMEI